MVFGDLTGREKVLNSKAIASYAIIFDCSNTSTKIYSRKKNCCNLSCFKFLVDIAKLHGDYLL